MASLLSEARDNYDLVVIDTPPLVLLPDAFPLLRPGRRRAHRQSVGREPQGRGARLRETLTSVDAPVIGVIANGYKRPRGASAYGYGYSYQYDYSHYAGTGSIVGAQSTSNGAAPDTVAA